MKGEARSVPLITIQRAAFLPVCSMHDSYPRSSSRLRSALRIRLSSAQPGRKAEEKPEMGGRDSAGFVAADRDSFDDTPLWEVV